MHSRPRHRHRKSGNPAPTPTRGLALNLGWRYDLVEWLADTFLFHSRLRGLRARAADLAQLQPGETVLDVGCGTGTLAIELQGRVGTGGCVFGIDPGQEQIARARTKAARRNLPIVFTVGVIERLDFPNHTFDVVFSTIMMHHLGDGIKRHGLAEIARVLKPGGRVVIADFGPRKAHQEKSLRFGSVRDLPSLVKDAGFLQMEIEEMQFARSLGFPETVVFVRASTPKLLPA